MYMFASVFVCITACRVGVYSTCVPSMCLCVCSPIRHIMFVCVHSMFPYMYIRTYVRSMYVCYAYVCAYVRMFLLE